MASLVVKPAVSIPLFLFPHLEHASSFRAVSLLCSSPSNTIFQHPLRSRTCMERVAVGNIWAGHRSIVRWRSGLKLLCGPQWLTTSPLFPVRIVCCKIVSIVDVYIHSNFVKPEYSPWEAHYRPRIIVSLYCSLYPQVAIVSPAALFSPLGFVLSICFPQCNGQP